MGYGDPVYAGEVIRTETSSRVKILMTDRSIIDIGEDSAIRIRTYPSNLASDGDRNLDLELGSVRASVKKTQSGKGKFFIRTKSSVLAVRGTEVIMDQNTATCVTGSADINGKPLGAGQSATFDGTSVGEIRNLNAKQLADARERNITDSSGDAVTSTLASDNAGDRKLASIGNVDPRNYQVGILGPGSSFYPNTVATSTTAVPVTVLVTFNPSSRN